MTSNTKTRFVLIGLGRCGSNLLKFALKQNPDIEMVGEYFNGRVYPESIAEDGARRVKDFYRASNASAIGFKLFAHQARKKPAHNVWNCITKDRDIRVIHLSRKNIFQRVLSLEVANVRGQFLGDDKGTDDIFIDLPPKEWNKKFLIDIKRERKLNKLFAKHPRAQLSYEDLIENWTTKTTELQQFLGVDPIDLKQKLTKQESMHPSIRCKNYEEICAWFANTEFAWMFDN